MAPSALDQMNLVKKNVCQVELSVAKINATQNRTCLGFLKPVRTSVSYRPKFAWQEVQSVIHIESNVDQGVKEKLTWMYSDSEIVMGYVCLAMLSAVMKQVVIAAAKDTFLVAMDADQTQKKKNMNLVVKNVYRRLNHAMVNAQRLVSIFVERINASKMGLGTPETIENVAMNAFTIQNNVPVMINHVLKIMKRAERMVRDFV